MRNAVIRSLVLPDTYSYNECMARPLKDPTMRMNVDLRIPLTADQKRVVAAAAARDQSDIAGWVRPILLKAAAERLERRSVAAQPSTLTWLAEAVVLAERGKKDESLDVIFDALDDLLLQSRFKECDEALTSMVTDRLSNAQLLTVLTATLQAKSRLPSRPDFVSRGKSTLRKRGADVKGLVSGLG